MCPVVMLLLLLQPTSCVQWSCCCCCCSPLHASSGHVVVVVAAHFMRPVVIFGVLADVTRDKLVREMPETYESPRKSQRTVTELLNISQDNSFRNFHFSCLEF